MDLYEALKERQVTWDDLEAAAVEEYRLLGKPVGGPEATGGGDRTPPPLLPSTSSTTATLGMGGWLTLTQWGLSPLQKRQASLGALTAGAQGISALDELPKFKEPGCVLIPLQPIVSHS
jgi:hypothetical protein